MSAIRIVRWIILLTTLFACAGWSHVAIHHLLGSSIAPQQRMADYNSAAESARVHRMDLVQQHWGKETMFALACSFFATIGDHKCAVLI